MTTFHRAEGSCSVCEEMRRKDRFMARGPEGERRPADVIARRRFLDRLRVVPPFLFPT